MPVSLKMQSSPPIFVSRKALRASYHRLCLVGLLHYRGNSTKVLTTYLLKSSWTGWCHFVSCLHNPRQKKWCFSLCHYVTTPSLPVRIHLPKTFPTLSCRFWNIGCKGQSQGLPSGSPFTQHCDDTQNDWDSMSCKLAAFTESPISIGGCLAYVTVCCSEKNINECSPTRPAVMSLFKTTQWL